METIAVFQLISTVRLQFFSGFLLCLFRKALNACPRLKHLNLTSCRGVPRGLKQWHAGATLRNLVNALEGM